MTSSIPKTMRGVVLEAFKKPYVYRTDIPVPTPKPDQMLIKMKAAGFCHTEVIAQQGDFKGKLPMVPGHENVGVICHVGEEVKGFAVGDRVGVGIFRDMCGECRECLRGDSTNYCSSHRMAGLTDGGGMAEYMLADPRWTTKLPDEMEFLTAAPLMCAGSTMFNSLKRTKLPAGSIVAIIGLGGLGHLGVQFAKTMGYKVVAVDTRSEPLALMSTLPKHLQPDLVINALDGADAAIASIKSTFISPTVPSLRATGVDAAIVSTDALPAFKFATEIIEKHGMLAVVGQPDDPIPLHYGVFISGDLTVIAGCLGQPKTNAEMMETVVKHGVHVEKRVYELQDADKLVHDYHAPGMKGKLVFKIED